MSGHAEGEHEHEGEREPNHSYRNENSYHNRSFSQNYRRTIMCERKFGGGEGQTVGSGLRPFGRDKCLWPLSIR